MHSISILRVRFEGNTPFYSNTNHYKFIKSLERFLGSNAMIFSVGVPTNLGFFSYTAEYSEPCIGIGQHELLVSVANQAHSHPYNACLLGDLHLTDLKLCCLNVAC